MSPTPVPAKVVLVRLVIGFSLAFVVLGLLIHGISSDFFTRFWQNMSDRPGGTFGFRFFLQPAMATIAAYRDGVRDARMGNTPFLWALLTDPTQRRTRLHEALVATSRIILLGLVMDTAFQIIEFDSFHPAEAVAIAFLLGLVPYILLRGLITHIARLWLRDRSGGQAK